MEESESEMESEVELEAGTGSEEGSDLGSGSGRESESEVESDSSDTRLSRMVAPIRKRVSSPKAPNKSATSTSSSSSQSLASSDQSGLPSEETMQEEVKKKLLEDHPPTIDSSVPSTRIAKEIFGNMYGSDSGSETWRRAMPKRIVSAWIEVQYKMRAHHIMSSHPHAENKADVKCIIQNKYQNWGKTGKIWR